MVARENYSVAYAVFLFLFFVTNHFVSGNPSCENTGFRQEKGGRRLEKHVIETMVTETALLCRIMCYLQESCRSYNYQPRSGTCQLSDSDEIESPDDLVYDADYVYVGRENPCQKNPCNESQICEPNFKDGSRHCRQQDVFRNCTGFYQAGRTSSGVYHIDPDGQGSFPVYCDMTIDGSAWTVFQKRFDGSVNFNRGWQDYKTGFGNLTGEFWLGLEKIFRLTKNKIAVLRVDVEDKAGKKGYAEYSSFYITDESDFYRLHVSGYSGTAGDSLSTASKAKWIHNNMRFSTFDKDNDMSEDMSCAYHRKGAWWFNSCYLSHLNGIYNANGNNGDLTAMCWSEFTSYCWGLKKSQMKVK